MGFLLASLCMLAIAGVSVAYPQRPAPVSTYPATTPSAQPEGGLVVALRAEVAQAVQEAEALGHPLPCTVQVEIDDLASAEGAAAPERCLLILDREVVAAGGSVFRYTVRHEVAHLALAAPHEDPAFRALLSGLALNVGWELVWSEGHEYPVGRLNV